MRKQILALCLIYFGCTCALFAADVKDHTQDENVKFYKSFNDKLRAVEQQQGKLELDGIPSQGAMVLAQSMPTWPNSIKELSISLLVLPDIRHISEALKKMPFLEGFTLRRSAGQKIGPQGIKELENAIYENNSLKRIKLSVSNFTANDITSLLRVAQRKNHIERVLLTGDSSSCDIRLNKAKLTAEEAADSLILTCDANFNKNIFYPLLKKLEFLEKFTISLKGDDDNSIFYLIDAIKELESLVYLNISADTLDMSALAELSTSLATLETLELHGDFNEDDIYIAAKTMFNGPMRKITFNCKTPFTMAITTAENIEKYLLTRLEFTPNAKQKKYELKKEVKASKAAKRQSEENNVKRRTSDGRRKSTGKLKPEHRRKSEGNMGGMFRKKANPTDP